MVSWGGQEKVALKLSEKGFGWQRFGGRRATVHTTVKKQESMGFDYNLRGFGGNGERWDWTKEVVVTE